jgi:hypothetical protein
MTAARRFGRGAVAALAACMACLAFVAASAEAFEFTEFSGSFSTQGQFERQAGSHPDFVTTLNFNETGARTVEVDFPPGLVADPTAVPTCAPRQLTEGFNNKFANCPVDSQVGFANIIGAGGAAVYNVERPAGAPALLAFTFSGVVVRIVPRVRSTDYGISSRADAISQALRITGTELKLWGVPADPANDDERAFQGNESGFGAKSTAPRRPFVTMPTSCSSEPLNFTGAVDSWWQPDVFDHASYNADKEGIPFRVEGCGRLRFEPEMSLVPDNREAGAPVGLSVDLEVPQSEAPYGLATPHVRGATVTLPEGFAINPSAGQGLTTCALAEVRIGSDLDDACPPASRIGTVQIKTPLLEEEMQGNVIVAQQGDNPFGTLIALYLVVEGPGVLLKIPGKVELDPVTGRVTTSFRNTPQLPFERLRMTLRGGDAAPLVAPQACGSYVTRVQMTSWASDTPVELSAPTSIDEGCGTGGFSPKLRAGSAGGSAGESSPFTFQVLRGDGEQNISRIEAILPEGLVGTLKGVPLCGDAAAAAAACPAASRVGRTMIGVGAGPSPLYVPQLGKEPTAIYLSGPYKGAPFSLVFKVPAQVGPFDLGMVTVRTQLLIDPVTAQVTAASESLPQILQGIPVTYRDVRVEMDRPGFMQNPTGCDPMKVGSRIVSSAGAVATPTAPFEVGNCSKLGFQPKFSMRFKGKTRRGGHPKLTATLTARKGDANIGKAVVILPKTQFLEQSHIRTICTRPQYAAGKCPKAAIYGYAKAWTPMLDQPLQGPVYLRSSNNTLPDLVADLNGQIEIDLAGRIDAVNERMRTTFWAIPDAPVSRFVLRMQGGRKSLIVNNTELCGAKPRVSAVFTGHNDKLAVSNSLVEVGCPKTVGGGK